MNMLRQYLKYVTLSLLLATTAASVCAASKGWEPVKAERADAKVVAKESEIQISSASSTIIISSNHPVQIKVFTILGRLVSNDSLPAGTMQLSLPAHGVYIVQVGGLTCKVAV